VVATEALLMKMKICKGSDLQSLERNINEWLEAKGINLIHHITHANNLSTTISGGASRDWFTIHSPMSKARHAYEVSPRKDHRGVELISDEPRSP